MIIAVDGPAASGKGTLARALAQHFGLAYLDTGSLYRAVAVRLLRQGSAPRDEKAAALAAQAISSQDFADSGLRSEQIGEVASQVAALAGVRAALLDYQRAFARHPPGGAPGAVMDGRDIGTVVLPGADKKLFITASSAVRARRRFLELSAAGKAASEADVLTAMNDRDRRDEQRAQSPLVPAPDAYLLDTTELDIDAAFLAAKAYISGSDR